MNEIEVEKIIKYKEYYKFNQNILTEQERQILNDELYFTLSYHTERIKNGWLENICRCCKHIFILGKDDYVICSGCKKILDNEINEFEEYIINKYDDIKNNYANGIYARIRLILFCERERILNKKFTPCGFYYYMCSNKINIGMNEIYKISKTLKYIYQLTHRYDDYAKSTDFDFLCCDYGEGSTDRKMMKAIKYCADLIPEIFTHYILAEFKN